MDTMAQYLHMAKQGREKLTQWKEVPDDTVTEGLHQGLALICFLKKSLLIYNLPGKKKLR